MIQILNTGFFHSISSISLFRTIFLKNSKTTIIRHNSMFKKKICFQNIPAEYKIIVNW